MDQRHRHLQAIGREQLSGRIQSSAFPRQLMTPVPGSLTADRQGIFTFNDTTSDTLKFYRAILREHTIWIVAIAHARSHLPRQRPRRNDRMRFMGTIRTLQSDDES
jgi:hypothetical protein